MPKEVKSLANIVTKHMQEGCDEKFLERIEALGVSIDSMFSLENDCSGDVFGVMAVNLDS